ncbi:hypothetical protein ACET3Z_014753 [Daucus carota]
MSSPLRRSRALSLILLLVLIVSTPSSNAKTLNRVIYQFLAPQNAARSALRMRPLVWDPKLARYAQWYANQRRWDCALQHSNGAYGENIFWGSGKGWSPAEAAAAWVGERRWSEEQFWSKSSENDDETLNEEDNQSIAL